MIKAKLSVVVTVLAAASGCGDGSAPIQATEGDETTPTMGEATHVPGMNEPGVGEPSMAEPDMAGPDRVEPGVAEPGQEPGGEVEDNGDEAPDEPSQVPVQPPPATGAAPLPNDQDIFGSKVIAMYIFREPYVTTQGNPPVVVSVVNAHAPGTHDVTFPNPPRWIADCGQDASGQRYGCARFDGGDDYGEGHGFSMQTGDRPSLIAVMKMNDVTDVTAIPFQITNEQGSQFMNLPEVRTQQGENLWRYNGSFTATPHNIDFGTPDLALHLHEQHLASPATLAYFDGVRQPDTGGDSGVTGPITMVSLGRRAPWEYAAVDIFEALIVDRPSMGEADAYRSQRVRQEYPSISLQ